MAARKKGGAKRGGAKRGGAKRGAKKGGSRGAAKRGGGRKRRAKRTGAKRTPNAAFMKAMQPSDQLSAVVGSGSMPRTEVTKKLWQYIKRKGLQDQKNRRMINADENLRPIFKRDQVSMFDMTKLVNKHLS